MSYTSPEKKILPAEGDNYDLVKDMTTFANSVRDIVSVVNQTEANAIVAAMAVDGRPVTDANPLYVFNNATKNIEIRDSSGWRPMVSTPPVGHMGVTTGFQTIGAGTVVNFAAAQILRGGVTFNAATNSLIVPYTGLYRFNLRILATGGAGYTLYPKLRRNTVNTGVYANVFKPDVLDYTGNATGIMQLTANDAMSLFLDTSTGAGNTWGTDGYNGTYLEMEMIGV